MSYYDIEPHPLHLLSHPMVHHHISSSMGLQPAGLLGRWKKRLSVVNRCLFLTITTTTMTVNNRHMPMMGGPGGSDSSGGGGNMMRDGGDQSLANHLEEAEARKATMSLEKLQQQQQVSTKTGGGGD